MALKAAIFEDGNNGALSSIENKIQASLDSIDPFSTNKENAGQIPFYVTGARALIKVGGKALAVAQKIRWSVTYNASPIQTIDASHAWDIDIGQCRINVDLAQIMDPTKGPEFDGIFHIMKSAIHQPMVEIQVLDRGLGTQYFFARGMFTEINGNVMTQQTGGWQARFVGVSYQHYISQDFLPYTGVSGAASALIDGLQDITSDLTGGIL